MTRVLGPELVLAGFTITNEGCVAYQLPSRHLEPRVPARGATVAAAAGGRRSAGRRGASSHATIEFEFHMSPACSSSRPQTGRGTLGDQLEEPAGDLGITAEPPWTADRPVEVRDRCRPASSGARSGRAAAGRAGGSRPRRCRPRRGLASSASGDGASSIV